MHFSQLNRFGFSRVLFPVLILAIGLSLTSCKKEQEATIQDEYYVKYEYETKLSHGYGGEDIVRLRLDDNYLTNDIVPTGGDEVIIGPVKRGFEAYLSVRNASTRSKTINTFIHVSKNGSPFALKASDVSYDYREHVITQYTIDY